MRKREENVNCKHNISYTPALSVRKSFPDGFCQREKSRIRPRWNRKEAWTQTVVLSCMSVAIHVVYLNRRVRWYFLRFYSTSTIVSEWTLKHVQRAKRCLWEMEMSQLAIAKRFSVIQFCTVFFCATVALFSQFSCSHSIPIFGWTLNLTKNILLLCWWWCWLLLLFERRTAKSLYHQYSALRWLVSAATLITACCCDTSKKYGCIEKVLVQLLHFFAEIIVKLF